MKQVKLAIIAAIAIVLVLIANELRATESVLFQAAEPLINMDRKAVTPFNEWYISTNRITLQVDESVSTGGLTSGDYYAYRLHFSYGY